MLGSAARYKEKILDKKTDKMMRNILKHANSEWREQRSTCAKILGPKNHDKRKRRRAGVVHTNWDNLWIKWSGCQRWWEVSKHWKSFVRTAEELCRRSLNRDVDKKKGSPFLKEMVNAQGKAEEERKNWKMKEREKQRIWDPACGNQKRIQTLGTRI